MKTPLGEADEDSMMMMGDDDGQHPCPRVV